MDKGYSCHQTSFGLVAVKAYNGDYNWEEAKTTCSQDGAELPMPRNSVENEWFGNKAIELGLNGVLLGISDKDLEGTWINQSGLAQTYFNWDRREPNNWGNEDCAELCVLCVYNQNWRVSGFEWNDLPCDHKRKILCTHIKGW